MHCLGGEGGPGARDGFAEGKVLPNEEVVVFPIWVGKKIPACASGHFPDVLVRTPELVIGTLPVVDGAEVSPLVRGHLAGNLG